MSITIEAIITPKCLNEPLVFWGAADNTYTAILSIASTGTTLGTTSGNNWDVPNSLTVSTVGMVCGKSFVKRG